MSKLTRIPDRHKVTNSGTNGSRKNIYKRKIRNLRSNNTSQNQFKHKRTKQFFCFLQTQQKTMVERYKLFGQKIVQLRNDIFKLTQKLRVR